MFPENAQFSAPSGFMDAIRDAASKNFMTQSEYLRRCALQQLERDGVSLPAPPAPSKRARKA
ncbi:hypothetical protein GCM10007301_47860 [Azorhizobium oxalatiphilum]|uniref:Uncharacterized protein n=1 Tax=Azorhizobium oxalatiphilum TaxID=980631 RepID=A0A917CB08_9HYPH|nr:hypothetical protein [Azorhizobium oxalatiphilum]GGF82168.1 hypothetical protein GCM10007301_47860 [Azorhizobium oxalatiphilum]